MARFVIDPPVLLRIALEPGLIRRAAGIVPLAGIDALLTRDV